MVYKYLPYFIFKVLFGDRKRWGLKTDFEDRDYIKWQNENYIKFYNKTQKGSIGTIVNHFGFKIVKELDMTDKIVMEVGPGCIEHFDYNSSRPEKYILADINKDFLDISEKKLQDYGLKNIEKINVKGIDIPLTDNSIDVLVSFHQLEHIYDLRHYLLEIKRILKPNGVLIGAVPTEGGLAWGCGRFLTSRRYAKKFTDINYDKIICWEHPNFVNKVKKILDENFENIKSFKKPFKLLPFDLNLSWSFIYLNKKD